MAPYDQRRAADLFLNDLLGESFTEGSERPDDGLRGPEPFFGDQTDQCWKVIARGGTRLTVKLRDQDLVVERRFGGGNLSWRCVPVSDVNLSSIYRGRSGVLSDDVVIVRRVRQRRWPISLPRFTRDDEGYGEIIEVAGFFGPNNVRRTEQEVRTAIVGRATAEWNSWHTTAGAPRRENEVAMFGRLVGYYLAAMGQIRPDTLTALQTAALAQNYATFLTASTAAAIGTEATRLAGLLVAGTADAADAALARNVAEAIRQARDAHRGRGAFRAWSAVFVVNAVRGAGITLGLEAAIESVRRHVGRDELILSTFRHAEYTVEARRRKAATTPRRRGTYHAFTPRERAPQLGDIIVQDRRDTINAAAQVMTLSGLTGGETHGDIVVEVQPAFVVTIGGNLGDSSRKRRYPRDAGGLLIVDRRERFTQEDDAGNLPNLPDHTTAPLDLLSTARIFALLSPVEEHAAVPGQPYKGGILT